MFDGFTEPLLLADEIHVLMIECKDIWSSTSYANVFHIRDIVNGELIQPFIGHIRHINGVMFVADETRVLSWADDGMIIVWNIADDSRKDTKPQHCRSVMLQWHGADPVRLVKYQKGGLIECNETESLQCMLGRNKVTLEELVRRQRLDDDGSPESFISQKKQ